MKKVILSLIILCLLIPGIAQAKSSQTALLINGNYITTGAPPLIINGTTYIPFRNLFENIDFTVTYSAEYKAASVWYNKGSFRVDFAIGSNDVGIHTTFIDETSAYLKISGKPILKNGSVYVPLRAFAELFGANVRYDKYIDTVVFNSTVNGIKQQIFPLVGLSLTDPRDNPNSGVTPVVDKEDNNTAKKALTAKEIAKLMDRVGIVDIYDANGNYLGLGSGFVIDGGMFITNSHVGHDNFIKATVDGRTYDTKGWYWFDNPTTDIYGTFLSTSYSDDGRVTGETPQKTLPYTTTLPEVGDKVYMIGSPQGFKNTLSEGIVSGIRSDGAVTYIQHTAATEGGSSGGALLNEYGEVIGVHSRVIKDADSLKFAIPIMYVQKEIDGLLSK